MKEYSDRISNAAAAITLSITAQLSFFPAIRVIKNAARSGIII
jgi:hypothetical protein